MAPTGFGEDFAEAALLTWIMAASGQAREDAAMRTDRTARRYFRAFTVAILAAAAAGSAWGQDRGAVLAARGQQLVTRNCAGCHAVGRSDTSARVGAPVFRELSRRYPIENLSEALAEGLVSGHPAMPEFVFPPGDVAAIIAYLKSIQVQQGAEAGARPRS